MSVTKLTRMSVINRDESICMWCGHQLNPAREFEYSLQHRRARAAGGSSKWFIDLAANLVLVHGTGTTGCHGYIEKNRLEAAARGFNIAQSTDDENRLPANYPIQVNVYGVLRWEMRDDEMNRFYIEASEAIRILTEFGVDMEYAR